MVSKYIISRIIFQRTTVTNGDIAYDAIRQASLASSPKKDYVKEGFVSQNLEDEIPAGPNYEVWITKSCVDVSSEVLAVLSSETDPLKRTNAMRDKRQEIAQTAQAKNDGETSSSSPGGSVRCDVQEMLPNESYVLYITSPDKMQPTSVGPLRPPRLDILG